MFKLLHEGASCAMGYLLADDDTAEPLSSHPLVT